MDESADRKLAYLENLEKGEFPMSIQPNAQLDEEGRIQWCSPESNIHRGHSACYVCQKDMRNVWDTVCVFCGHIFCYAHSIAIGKKWYCHACVQVVKDIISDLAKFVMKNHNGAAGPNSCVGCAILKRHADMISAITDLTVEYIDPMMK